MNRLFSDCHSASREIISRLDALAFLAARDFRRKYLGSALGAAWAVVQPGAAFAALAMVFSFGFDAGPVDGRPYALWLLAGLLPWMFFAEALTQSVSALTEQGHLIRNLPFAHAVFPLAKIISALAAHLVFLALFAAFSLAAGGKAGPDVLRLAYALGAMIVLLTGLGLLSSSLMALTRDVGHAVAVFVNIWFWVTPVVWPAGRAPSWLYPLMALNPVQYAVESCRGALLGLPDATDLWQAACFWLIAGLTLLAGLCAYARLKPHFADCL